jgi:hypothetical protein
MLKNSGLRRQIYRKPLVLLRCVNEFPGFKEMERLMPHGEMLMKAD